MVARSSRQATSRRLAALALACAATAAIWLLVVRGDGDEGPEGARERAAGVSAPVAGLVRGLSPDELVDQVLLLGFEGTDATGAVANALRGRQLGGVIVGAANWLDPAQAAALIAELRAAGLAGGRVPPLVATAQEGGPHRAFPALPPGRSALEVGDSGSVALAERWSREAGRALRALGVDLNLFPVADVATLDSPVADRAFSDDAAVAAEMTVAAVRGCHAAAIACAVLHFPGLGAASQDPAGGPATVSLDRASLAGRDLVAFRAAFDAGVEAVVLSNASYAAYDPVTPGGLAPEVATSLLRDELGFAGVAISDLGAGAVTAARGVPEAAVTALRAGADLLRIDSPADQPGVREALLRAAASGEIPRARLREAAGRVLELKRAVGLLARAL